MATAYPTRAPAAPAPSAARWLPTTLSAAVTLTFAVLAFRLSFDALTDQAIRHGVEPSSAWMFATLVDGGALVGTVGVLAAQHAGRRTWPYWATTVAFFGLSLVFNIAHSDGTPIGVAIAVTPPAALVVSIELLVRLLPAPPADGAEVAPVSTAVPFVEPEPSPAVEPDAAPDFGALVAAVSQPAVPEPVSAAAPQDEQPAPLAAVFTAPPAPEDEPEPDEASAPAETGPEEISLPKAAEVYERVKRNMGRRPTGGELGAALGVRRERGGKLREAIEEHLTTCAVIDP